MKPTSEQIEKYIKAAELELGIECVEEWVKWINNHIRNIPHVSDGSGFSEVEAVRTYGVQPGGGGGVTYYKRHLLHF